MTTLPGGFAFSSITHLTNTHTRVANLTPDPFRTWPSLHSTRFFHSIQIDAPQADRLSIICFLSHSHSIHHFTHSIHISIFFRSLMPTNSYIFYRYSSSLIHSTHPFQITNTLILQVQVAAPTNIFFFSGSPIAAAYIFSSHFTPFFMSLFLFVHYRLLSIFHISIFQVLRGCRLLAIFPSVFSDDLFISPTTSARVFQSARGKTSFKHTG